MTGVRNGALGRIISSVPGTSTIGTVPANVTWLLKTVQVLNAGGGPAAGVIGMSQSGGGVQAQFAAFDLEPGAGVTIQSWVALEPGDAVYLSADAANLHIWASGAELPGVKPG